VEALRTLLFPASTTELPLSYSLLVLGGFTLVMFVLAFAMANRRSTKPAA